MMKLSISQPFEELQGRNLELKLITPIYITGSHFGTMVAILDFLIIDGFWSSRCLNDRLKVYFWMLLLKRGPKGPQALRRS